MSLALPLCFIGLTWLLREVEATTPAPTMPPMTYFYGQDNAMISAGETTVISLGCFIFAVGLEYALDRLKRQEGTYIHIVSGSVLQETMIVGMVTMSLTGVLTVVQVTPLYVEMLRSAAAGLLLMVFFFVLMIALLTLGLLWSRRGWRLFEKTRMAADLDVASSVTLQGAALSEALLVNDGDGNSGIRPEDDEDNESAGPRVGAMVGGSRSGSFPGTPTNRTATGSPVYSRRGSLDGTESYSRSAASGGGLKSPSSTGSPRLTRKKSVMIHEPEAPGSRRRPLVLPGSGPDEASTPTAPQAATAGYRGKKGKRDSARIFARTMTDFSNREQIYTRSRDLWIETLMHKKLYNPMIDKKHRSTGVAATTDGDGEVTIEDIANSADDEELLFTDYIWKITPEVMRLVADLGWKAWAVLALFVVIDGVRGVIIIGEETVVSQTLLTTSIVSFVFLGGTVPLGFFLVLVHRLQVSLDRVTRKPLMRQHERENQPHMVKPSEGLYFRSIETSAQIFQIVLLILEWYSAFFYLTFSQPIVEFYGGTSLLVYLGAGIPIAVFLWQMPWTITVIAMLSGLGADLDESIIQEMRDDLKVARGSLPDKAIRELEEYAQDLPGEWNPALAVTLHREASQPPDDGHASSVSYAAPSAVASRPLPVPSLVAPGGGGNKTAAAGGGAATTTTTATHHHQLSTGHRPVILRPPKPAFAPLIPQNRILPSEREYFERFADPVPAAYAGSSGDDSDDDSI